MTKLIITRGLPGSGKTTRAKAWVAEDPENRARVNRDDLRAMMHDGVFIPQTQTEAGTERAILFMRDAAISTLLKRGIDTVCDDTNLPNRVVRDLRSLAILHGAEFEVWDMTDVPLETCLERNAQRWWSGGQHVPEAVIREMHKKYIHKKGYPIPIVDPTNDHGTVDGLKIGEPYVPKPGTPRAIIVDIDGTVALMGTRDPFDETRVHEDKPNVPVCEAVWAMSREGYKLIFVSGRSAKCYEETRNWLQTYVCCDPDPELTLYMRAQGDTRKDSVVKLELFNQHIRDSYDVVAVFDDRNQVVEMWRELGLTVFQVADGDF